MLRVVGLPIAIGEDEEVAKYSKIRFKNGLEAFLYVAKEIAGMDI